MPRSTSGPDAVSLHVVGRAVVTRLVAMLLLAGVAAAQAGEVPPFAAVRARQRASDAWLLDRQGTVLQQVRIDATVRHLEWVVLDDVSPAFRQAILRSEDRRFYEHGGVDWAGLAAAAWRSLWSERARGASTITMQLAALLDPDLARPAGGRSLLGKWEQMRAARALDVTWRKDQILEAYVNLVPFRSEIVGIAALAQGYFGKHPRGLDRRESALAAVLVRSPGASPDRVAQRACALLRGQDVATDCEGLASYAGATLGRQRPIAAPAADAPHFARKLLKTPGERLVSTLDANLQRLAQSTVRRHLRELTGRNVEDAAAIVIDNASGDVLAWVGGSGDFSDAPHVDAAAAPRQAGSTLKPFLYGLALEGRWITAASILDDSPLSVLTGNGLYVPQNYDRSFHGRVSVRRALGSSLNVPAVRTLVMVGPEAFHRRLYTLGFDSLRENGDYYGYSLALGSAEVSLAMLANAYRTLANGGRYAPLRQSLRDPQAGAGTQVMDGRAAYVVADILADRNARVGTFGLGSSLDTPQWSAVKTGTSKDMRDNWCVGFDDRYTVAVWVGNLSGAPMWDVSGVTGAAPIWQALMIELQRGRRVVPPRVPPGVVRTRIEFDRRFEPAREEVFLAGTERTRVTVVAEAARDGVRIVYPAQGTILALDPDIPPAHQGVVFAARVGRAQGLAWWLDGKGLGDVAKAQKWLPWPGRHRLALVDRAGRELDVVEFEVRGALVKPAVNR